MILSIDFGILIDFYREFQKQIRYEFHIKNEMIYKIFYLSNKLNDELDINKKNTYL